MYTYINDKEKALEAAKEIQEYCLTGDHPILSIDLETCSFLGFQPRPILRPDGSYEGNISLFQVGLNPRVLDNQYIFDVKALGEEFIGNLFRGWIEDVLILGQNFKYDYGFIRKQL